METAIIAKATFTKEFHIINWDQYANILSRDRITQVVEEYNVQQSYDPVEETGSYMRVGVEVKNMENPNELFKTQFLEQLSQNCVEFTTYSNDLQDAIEQATSEALLKLNPLTESVVVKLSETEYVLAPYDRESLILKLLSPVQGALMIYTPFKFVPFRLAEKSGAV